MNLEGVELTVECKYMSFQISSILHPCTQGQSIPVCMYIIYVYMFCRHDGTEEDDGEAWSTQNTFRVEENDSRG